MTYRKHTGLDGRKDVVSQVTSGQKQLLGLVVARQQREQNAHILQNSTVAFLGGNRCVMQRSLPVRQRPVHPLEMLLLNQRTVSSCPLQIKQQNGYHGGKIGNVKKGSLLNLSGRSKNVNNFASHMEKKKNAYTWA